MIEYYKTDDRKVYRQEALSPGQWIKMTAPTPEESWKIAFGLDIDVNDIRAAIDREEKTRIELFDNYTLIVIDVPTTEQRHDRDCYITIPLGVILMKDRVITICSEDTPILHRFQEGRVQGFSTKKQLRFFYQIMFVAAGQYQLDLRSIDKRRREIEERIHSTDEEMLIELHELESTLVYFATSLRENGNVLSRLTHYDRIEQFPDDTDLLNDVIVENQQAIEMTEIYQSIINGTRELMSTILDSRLSNVMKILTSVTVILAIPTVISGIYGMNLNGRGMPLSSSVYGFGVIVLIILIVCILMIPLLKKLKML
ncbi:MAG: magnesium transporter CorA family protein [Anaerovoracaceae bacterium]|jgi:magnesium transporter